MGALQNFVARSLPAISAVWLNLVDLIKVQYDQTDAEILVGVTPTNKGFKAPNLLRYGADRTGVLSSDTAIAQAISVAKFMGVQNTSTGRDQGVDIPMPEGLYLFNTPIVLPRSGNPQAFCVGLVGEGISTRLTPGPGFPAARGLIEWEATTARVFNQRLRNFKIDMRTGLNHKAVWFKLNDPTTKVFGGQPWGQEEIKKLSMDIEIHGDNSTHAILVDIEGKIKYSNIKIIADMTPGTSTVSSLILQANSELVNSGGTHGDKSDAVAGDNAGVNFSELYVFGVNSRGGRTSAFKGRLHNTTVTQIGSVTGALGTASVIELYGSSLITVLKTFMEGRQENSQIYMEECYYCNFLSCNIGTPDAPGPATAFKLVNCEDNIFTSHGSAIGKPAYSSQGGYLIDLDAGTKRNKFYNFGSTAAFTLEVRDLGVDNYVQYLNETDGLVSGGDYPKLLVTQFGADPTGVIDSSAAFHAAVVAQQFKKGGEILVPPGLYKVNLVITGSGIHFKALGLDKYDDNAGTVGLIAATAINPVLQVGDGTITTRGLTFTGFSVMGISGADKGIRVYGANRVMFERCAVRGFDEYQIQIDSSASLSTSRIHWNRLDLATGTAAGSLGIDFNYGASSATAIFFSNSSMSAAAGGGHLIDLEDNAQIRLTNSWLQCRDLQGIRFRGAGSRLVGAPVIIDSTASTDVLFEFDSDTLLPDQVTGVVTADGIARMPSGDTASLTGRNYIARASIARELHIQTALHFQDTALGQNAQHALGTLPQRITRTGTALQLRSTDGNLEARLAAAGELILREDGTTTAARLRFGTSGALVIYGTGTPEGAVAAPKGSLFLRGDGGAATTLYVKETGAGNTGWAGK